MSYIANGKSIETYAGAKKITEDHYDDEIFEIPPGSLDGAYGVAELQECPGGAYAVIVEFAFESKEEAMELLGRLREEWEDR